MRPVAILRGTNQDTLPAGLFPLPLTVVEKFMVVDSTARYPMLCDIEVQFQGTIEKGPCEEALAFALNRAPIFRSVIEPDPKRGLHWRLVDRWPTVDWDEYGVPYRQGYDQQIDLEKEPGLRVYVRAGSERSTLLLHCHHACADAVGMFAFVQDFLTGYASATPGAEAVEPRKWEPERLLQRSQSALENPGLARGLYDVYCGLRGAYSFFSERPLPLSAGLPTPPEDSQRKQLGFITQGCPPEILGRLRGVSTARKVSLNDLLLRDLFVTLDRQLHQDGSPVGKRTVRVLMPQSLRGRGDGAMPTTNDMGFAFLSRRGTLCQQPDPLLASLAEETAAIRTGRLSRHFIGGLEAIDKMRALPWLLGGKRCFSTAVLTNFGNAWRRFEARFPPAGGGFVVGNLIYDCLVGVPPIRPQTAAAFSVTTTADRLFISLKHDPFYYTRAETEQLLSQYIAQIETSAKATP